MLRSLGDAGMTSDTDDLEEQLRQNLKLRRELAAEVTKVRDRNAKDRLGWVLYWTFLALAGTWVFLWLWMLHGGFFGLQSAGVEHAIEVFMLNPFEQLAFMGIPVLMLYSFGRAIRYVLSGE
jgi:hypothetical protein